MRWVWNSSVIPNVGNTRSQPESAISSVGYPILSTLRSKLPLVEGASLEPGDAHYVIERHAIRIVPGLSALLRSPTSDWNEMFVGIGDPIYNRADPRLVRSKPSAGSSPAKAPGADPAAGIMELPRLLGSGREVDNCAKIW